MCRSDKWINLIFYSPCIYNFNPRYRSKHAKISCVLGRPGWQQKRCFHKVRQATPSQSSLPALPRLPVRYVFHPVNGAAHILHNIREQLPVRGQWSAPHNADRSSPDWWKSLFPKVFILMRSFPFPLPSLLWFSCKIRLFRFLFGPPNCEKLFSSFLPSAWYPGACTDPSAQCSPQYENKLRSFLSHNHSGNPSSYNSRMRSINGVIGSISRWITLWLHQFIPDQGSLSRWYPHRSAWHLPFASIASTTFAAWDGTSAGIPLYKMSGIFSIWQIIDKHGNVRFLILLPSSARSLTAVESVITYSLPSPAIWLYTPSSNAFKRVDFPWYPPPTISVIPFEFYSSYHTSGGSVISTSISSETGNKLRFSSDGRKRLTLAAE